MNPVIETAEDSVDPKDGAPTSVGVRRRRVRSGSQGVRKDMQTTDAVVVSGASTSDDKKQPARKTRYGRSATISVTQLLSDSCNSLLQKFRRNPSERPEKKMGLTSNSQTR